MTRQHDHAAIYPRFRKSSYSTGSNASCVEVAGEQARIAVRDSKNPTGPVLGFTDHGWTAFATGVRRTTA